MKQLLELIVLLFNLKYDWLFLKSGIGGYDKTKEA